MAMTHPVLRHDISLHSTTAKAAFKEPIQDSSNGQTLSPGQYIRTGRQASSPRESHVERLPRIQLVAPIFPSKFWMEQSPDRRPPGCLCRGRSCESQMESITQSIRAQTGGSQQRTHDQRVRSKLSDQMSWRPSALK